jgi:hypothetical protein
VKTLASFAGGIVFALIAGAAWNGCGCPSDEMVPIAGGSYELVEPDPTPFVGYVLTYTPQDGTVHESFTRNGVVHDTVYTVTFHDP